MSYDIHPSDTLTHEARQSPWRFLLFITVIFLLSYHDLSNAKSPVGDYNGSQDDVIASAKGSLLHYISLSLLGVVAIISLVRHRSNGSLRLGGSMGWLLLGFVGWAFISPLWAEDFGLTAQRLAGFGILCITAVAVASRASLRQIILWTCFTTTFFLLVGILGELVFGTFTPFVAGYRFAGTLLPNNTGVECGLLMLSGLAAADMERRWRIPFWGCALFGFVFLILSGSRTALTAAVAALGVYIAAVASRRVKIGLALGFGTILCFLLLALGPSALPSLQRAVLLGRDDPDKIGTLSDRTMIWEDVSSYIGHRPILGYGYGGFWTPAHISAISDEQQAGVPNGHSTYIDYLLSLGTVGLTAYVFLLLAGTGRAFHLYRLSQNVEFAFCTVVLVFCAIDGLLESAIADGGTVKFLCMIILVQLAFVPFQTSSQPSLRVNEQCASSLSVRFNGLPVEDGD